MTFHENRLLADPVIGFCSIGQGPVGGPGVLYPWKYLFVNVPNRKGREVIRIKHDIGFSQDFFLQVNKPTKGSFLLVSVIFMAADAIVMCLHISRKTI